MKTFGILNGPNLNRLGTREPHIYGSQTLQDLTQLLQAEAALLKVELLFHQNNCEGSLIDTLAQWSDSGVSGAIINAAGLTHTSVALRDAIAACTFPAVEVHISNIHRREEFRHNSITAPACIAQISGMGFEGYLAALRFLAKQS